MRHLVWLFLTVLVAALVPAAPAGAATASQPIPIYTYSDQQHSSHVTDSAAERGPPATHDRATTYNAIDHRSHGAAARQDDATIPAAYDYDGPSRFAQVARGSRVTEGPAGDAGPSSVVVEPSSVAAKGAGEAGALVRYDAQAASRNLLGQVGEGYARTPSGYTVSARAAERIV